jgi:hypothetical protein
VTAPISSHVIEIIIIYLLTDDFAWHFMGQTLFPVIIKLSVTKEISRHFWNPKAYYQVSEVSHYIWTVLLNWSNCVMRIPYEILQQYTAQCFSLHIYIYILGSRRIEIIYSGLTTHPFKSMRTWAMNFQELIMNYCLLPDAWTRTTCSVYKYMPTQRLITNGWNVSMKEAQRSEWGTL